MKSKGQIDMFGLVIIVILLVVIALFSLFFIGRGSSDDRDIYYSLRAYNFANALSKASVDNTNMESLILSCCLGSGGSCGTLMNFVDEKFEETGFSDEEIKFELDCYSGYKDSRGECGGGIASESIILQSGDLIRVILCRR
jgi:hypothetical protein